MFTVKHIHLCGAEEIFQVHTVRYTPGGTPDQRPNVAASATPETLWVRSPDWMDEKPLTGGTVFVMNDIGKTVARYDLGASPVPIIGDGLSDPRPKGLEENVRRAA